MIHPRRPLVSSRMPKILPHKLSYIPQALGNKPFTLLDIGAGNGSPSTTKHFFPLCEYHGVDRENYENSQADFDVMTAYYQLDLTELQFDVIPDGYFDVIVMAHVIEHLHNGDEVIALLLSKLKPGGMIYIEYPGVRSTKLPSMRGTLNFYDDPTHVRLYSVSEVSRIVEAGGCRVVRAGTRRHWPVILLFPFALMHQTLKYGYVPGGVFWDLLGFAEFVVAQKSP